MNDNLTPFAQRLLLAIHDLGAQPGKEFVTTANALVDAAGATSADFDIYKAASNSLESLKAVLHSLVTNGVSVQKSGQFYMGSYLSSAEVFDDGKVIVTIGAPRAYI